MGVARVLKPKWPGIHIVVCEPASSPALTKGTPGSHHVEGVGIGYCPPLLDSGLYDEVRAISEQEGRKIVAVLLQKRLYWWEPRQDLMLSRLLRWRGNWGLGKPWLQLRVTLG